MTIFHDLVLKLRHAIANWFQYHVVFSKAVIFITGVIYSYSLVENGVLLLLITHLPGTVNLPKAASIVSLKEGLTALMAIVSAHIADAYIGRFFMLLISTPAYAIGLVLLFISFLPNTEDTKMLLYVGLVLIALGKASREPLKTFIADQFEAEDRDESRVEARTKVWWRFASFLALVVIMFGLSKVSDANLYGISALMMAVAYVLFLCGIPFYCRSKPGGSPLTSICRVFVAAALKCRLDYPLHLYKDDLENSSQSLLPHTSRLRWLDKAAITETSPQGPEEQEKKWWLCTVTQVEETKLLLGMVPIWTTFLVYSLVKSTGSTFFIEQADNMNDFMDLPISSMCVFKSSSSFVVSYLYELLSKRLAKSQERFATKVRIGFGMLLSIFCCSTAWRVEARRLNIVKKLDLQHKPEDHVPMTILRLAPQFCLVGAMEGLAEDGLRDFFYDQCPESMRRYGLPLNDCVIGIGNLLIILLVYKSRCWFADNINDSRLDEYYRTLMIFSFLNLCFYCYIASTYTKDEPTTEKVELKQVVTERVTDATKATATVATAVAAAPTPTPTPAV